MVLVHGGKVPTTSIHPFNRQVPTVEMASLAATASPQASFTAPPPVLRSASSLYAVASTGEEDHRRCGPECSLNQVVRASKKQPLKAYKKTWRMYDGWDEMAKRVSTAVPLKDGSILQVFPEKRWFAGLIAWRSTFPHAWETRIYLSSELAALYGGKREMAMAPLSVEDVEEDDDGEEEEAEEVVAAVVPKKAAAAVAVVAKPVAPAPAPAFEEESVSEPVPVPKKIMKKVTSKAAPKA